ncbi:MAG: CHASE2 domain-containing protein, partial [Gammaproteobacteria bacterium]|nr:CHASE2 domain-containing protein [Gammaproteobacteria bacterium]
MSNLLQKLKLSKPRIVGLAIVFSFLWLQTSPVSWLSQPIERIEALAYDMRLNATIEARQVDTRVVIIDIDEKSLQQVGHWPWPRDIIGQLIEKIFAHGAAVVGFDMVFPEEEKNSAQVVIDQLEQTNSGLKNGFKQELIQYLDSKRERFDNNVRFAESFADKDVVLGYVLDYREGEPIGVIPEPPEVINREQALEALGAASTTNYTANVATLQNATPFAGFFSLRPDIDGVIRRTPLLARINDQIYPSLSLEILRVFKLVDEIEVITASIADLTVIEGVRVGESLIPTDMSSRAYIPFRGGWGSFPYIPAVDILNDTPLKDNLEGAIVLIGTTAHGLFDLRSTPTEPIYPGVEVHANIIS